MVPTKRKVYVIGVGMTKFEKPGRRKNFDYPQMAEEACKKALADAGISFKEIQQAAVGFVYGDSTSGQRAVYPLGMTGIPIYNVNNNCATGSTALVMAKQFIEGGLAECSMALGFEKMKPGSLTGQWHDRTSPMDRHSAVMESIRPRAEGPYNPQMFGNAGLEHMDKYGTKPIHFAKIAWKNHKHSVNNPYSQFQKEYSMEEIQKSKKIYDFLTLLQCCPTSDGSGCAILASEDFVNKHGLEHQAVEIVGMTMATDLPSTLEERSCMKIVGYDMTRHGVENLYKETGIKPADVDVIELHDCFSANELITYEALGLCPEGGAGNFIDKGDNTYGGRYVINPSGGLISKGHPLGATGLAQCAELCWQLRGEAANRQVPGAKLALQHNLGLGGAVVVGIYRLGFPDARAKWLAQKRNRLLARTISTDTSPAPTFKTTPLFEDMRKVIEKEGASYVKKINGIIGFKVEGPNNKEVIWAIDAKNGNGSLKLNSGKKCECYFSMKDEDLFDLMTGKLDGNKAFFSGKLKISGNMGLAMKLDVLLARPKL